MTSEHAAGVPCRLVLNGDIVDFLAEEPFIAFTSDPTALQRKLDRIFHEFEPVFSALAEFVAVGGELTLLLGNHDIELSLPAARAMLKSRIGEVEFIYDNEAYTVGDLLIEHGNRYDPWNAVPHDVLRRIRSAQSRLEPSEPLPPIPGSELVINVLNPIKRRYPFIDLLKPEDAAALPILAVLAPSSLLEIRTLFQLYARTRSRRVHPDGGANDRGLVSAPASQPESQFEALAVDLALDDDRGLVSDGVSPMADLFSAMATRNPNQSLRKLRRALIAWEEAHRSAWSLSDELRTYLDPAKSALERGFGTVVYGHTHLPKIVGVGELGTYVNTGTWADLIRVPDIVFKGNENDSLSALREFLSSIRAGDLHSWREVRPTFASIDLLNGVVQSSALCEYHPTSGAKELERRVRGSK